MKLIRIGWFKRFLCNKSLPYRFADGKTLDIPFKNIIAVALYENGDITLRCSRGGYNAVINAIKEQDWQDFCQYIGFSTIPHLPKSDW